MLQNTKMAIISILCLKKKISKTVKDKSLKISLVFLTIKMKQDLQFRDTYSTFKNVWLVVSYFIDLIFAKVTNMNSVMRSSVIVDHFKNFLWHTWCKHFWRTSIVHFCKLQWPSPQRFSGFRSREHHFVLLEDVPCPGGIVYCSIVLLKNPVATTQTRALSHDALGNIWI